MRVKFSAQARTDLTSIGLFIASDSPYRADLFVSELQEKTDTLKSNPRRFRKVKSFEGGDVRRMAYRGYSVFYQSQSDSVLILRIVHDAVVTGRFVDDLK